MSEDECVQVTTTGGSREQIDRLARLAVERRLAACAQVMGPITSTYHWQGAVEVASEWQCVIKTTAVRAPELTAMIRSEHPYEVPEVVVTPIVGGNPAYLDWIAQETS